MATLNINDKPYEATTFRILELHADYGCKDTGDCCRMGWGIPLHAGELQRLKTAMQQSGTGEAEIEGHFKPLTGRAQDGRVAALRSDSEGCCTFVEGETGCSRCGAQASYGHAVLPSICQAYPRMVVRTPAGVYMTLSYRCPTAARLLLQPDGLREVAPRGVMRNSPGLAGCTMGDGHPGVLLDAATRAEWAAFDYFWRWAVEFVARPGLTPAQALWSLGIAVQAAEQHARVVAKPAAMVGLLESVSANPATAFAKRCAAIPPSTTLGRTYFHTLLNLLAKVGNIPAEFDPLWDRAAGRPRDVEGLEREYDERVRPKLGEFELVERNWVGSRLYANALAWRGKRLRTGYFVNVLLLVALRWIALGLCLRDGKSLDEETLLSAAGLTDQLLFHHASMQQEFLDLLEPHIDTELENLMLPALA